MTTENRAENRAESRDIEQLIYDIAEHARDEDYTELYESLADRLLFIPVDKDSLDSIPNDIKSGELLSAETSTQVPVRYVSGPRGDSFMPVVTAKTSPMVADGYARVYWLEALTMALNINEVVGILLQGENSWIGFYKPQIEHILSVYKTEDSESA